MREAKSSDLARILIGVLSARFGPGAIGRIGTIAIGGSVCLCVLAVVFAFVDIRFAGAVAAALVVFLFFVVWRAFNYAEANPEVSAMDGAQISRVLTQQAAMKPLEGLAPPPPAIEGELVQNPLAAESGEDA